MQPTQKEIRMFGGMALFLAGLLGLAWGWFAFTASPSLQIPTPPLPKPNAFDSFVQATKVQTSTADLDKIFGPPPKTRRSLDQRLQLYRAHSGEVDNWLKQNATALQLFRRGLAQPYREPPQGGMMLSPHSAGFRELARIGVAESDARAARGNWPGAAQSAVEVLHFGHQVPRGAPLIGSLVGYAIQSTGRRQLQELLPYLDAPTCRAAARELEKQHAARLPFSEVLQQEKWATASFLLNTMRSSKAQSLSMQLYGYNAATKEISFRPVSQRRMMKDFLSYMDALSAAAKLPYATAPVPAPPNDFYNGRQGRTYVRARWNHARAEAGNTLLMLALALRAYQLEQGAYPEKLAQILPDYLKAIPTDGFGSGEALRYKKQKDTYLLWSVGPDKKDNGGQAIDNPGKKSEASRRGVSDDSQGDFVFGVNR